MAEGRKNSKDSGNSDGKTTAGIVSLKGSVSAKVAVRGTLDRTDEELKAACIAELGEELYRVLNLSILLNHLGTRKMFAAWIERSRAYRRRGWLLSGSQPFDDAKTVKQLLIDLASSEAKLKSLGWSYDTSKKHLVQTEREEASGRPFSLMGYCIHKMALKNGWTKKSLSIHDHAERILRRFFPADDLSKAAKSKLYRALRHQFEDKKRPTKSRVKASKLRKI